MLLENGGGREKSWSGSSWQVLDVLVGTATGDEDKGDGVGAMVNITNGVGFDVVVVVGAGVDGRTTAVGDAVGASVPAVGGANTPDGLPVGELPPLPTHLPQVSGHSVAASIPSSQRSSTKNGRSASHEQARRYPKNTTRKVPSGSSRHSSGGPVLGTWVGEPDGSGDGDKVGSTAGTIDASVGFADGGAVGLGDMGVELLTCVV